MFYRVTVNGVGIYEYIDRTCPKGDSRRQTKPDGSWVVKAGKQYPNTTSWWTEQGWKKYTDSGLRAWHSMVANNEDEIVICEKLNDLVAYEDVYQVLVE